MEDDMQLNAKARFDQKTHQGAAAARMSAEQALRRSVLSCLLWEREFYEEGESIAQRILALCEKVAPVTIAELAVEAREQYHLRHVPLLLASALARHARGDAIVANTIHRVIQRADELTEFVVVHALLNGVTPDKVKNKLSSQIKKGLARAFTKFDAYQLAKYDRANVVRLRDVLFLCHAKPVDDSQADVWKKLVSNELQAPDTWEVALSGGADAKDTFERLMREEKLGYLALLRNLRNMNEAGCDEGLVREALLARRGAHRVLPFRYLAAARACPRYEDTIDQALVASIAEARVFPGKTIVLVDVSGSMQAPLSQRSDLSRLDAGAVLASVITGDVRVFSFSQHLREVPPRRGMAGVDAILNSQPRGATYLGMALQTLMKERHDRLIVITDEQSADDVPLPVAKHSYMINVASAKNGVGYGEWIHIDGFSESIFRFIQEYEANEYEGAP